MFIAEDASTTTATGHDGRRPDVRPDSIIRWEPERGSVRRALWLAATGVLIAGCMAIAIAAAAPPL
ncbi:MAG: hypothetical protein R8G01_01220 [Ilumatobacteraceae bacterium]|nr:hypothetical protein [Ilumatobacteraceae bacterium]